MLVRLVFQSTISYVSPVRYTASMRPRITRPARVIWNGVSTR